jgi:hypothetical protein
MAIVNLPSARKAKTLAEVIDVVEKMRKELEFALSTLDSDNMNNSYVSVIESGYNTNGFYRKFSDGMMECWTGQSIILSTLPWYTTNVGGGTYYYTYGNWNFPIPFKEGEIVNLFASGDIAGAAPENHTAYHLSHAYCQVENGIFGLDVRTSGNSLNRSMLARGRWK